MGKDPCNPRIVVQNGKPVAVLLDIDDYEALLELAEQKEDMRAMRAMKRRDWRTISFDAYLQRKRRRVLA